MMRCGTRVRFLLVASDVLSQALPLFLLLQWRGNMLQWQWQRPLVIDGSRAHGRAKHGKWK